MSKSPLAILGLGGAACLVLSLFMQQLLDYRQAKCQSPVAQALAVQFEGRLVGPVRVAEERTGLVSRLRVQLTAIAGLQKPRLAQQAGITAWGVLRGTPNAPDEVLIHVADEDGGPVEELAVPRPPRPATPIRPPAKAPPATPPRSH